MGMVDPSDDDPEAAYTVLDFWERAAARVPRRRHACRRGTPMTCGPTTARSRRSSSTARRRRSTTTSASAIKTLQRHHRQLPVPPVVRHPIRRTATPVPTRCPATTDGSLLVRDFTQLAKSDFCVERRRCGRAVLEPHRRVRARRREVPGHRLRHVVHDARGLPRPTRALRAVHDRRRRRASSGRSRSTRSTTSSPPSARRRSAHYRNIAAMDRDEKIRCGAYVYFSFLRPFALAAGVADDLDWTVPRDIPESALRLRVAARGRQRRDRDGRALLRPDRVTGPFDEGRHEPEPSTGDWHERWTFEAWDEDATFGAVAAITLVPASRQAWYGPRSCGKAIRSLTAGRHRAAHAVQRRWRCEVRACGPTTCARRHSSTGRCPTRRSPSRSTIPTKPWARSEATSCRSASISSGSAR